MRRVDSFSRYEEKLVSNFIDISQGLPEKIVRVHNQQGSPYKRPDTASDYILGTTNDDIAKRSKLLYSLEKISESGSKAAVAALLRCEAVNLGSEAHNIARIRRVL